DAADPGAPVHRRHRRHGGQLRRPPPHVPARRRARPDSGLAAAVGLHHPALQPLHLVRGGVQRRRPPAALPGHRGLPLWIAKQLTGLFGAPGSLDLRVLGILFAVAVGAAVGWTARELPGPRWTRVLIASAIGLVADDSTIAPYFISPFSEPAALLG